jgi:deazaflavin-dependent oxidoreductase (nitroreductase family)
MGRYSTLVQRLGHQRWFATVGRWVTPVDRWLQRRTRGKLTTAGWHPLPYLLLTTTGRRTGQPMTQPLLYARDGDDYVVVGSNWGQAHHPAWTANLLARPDAVVSVDGRAAPVRAVLAEGADREHLLDELTRVWPAYRTYQRRAAGRDLRVFRLTSN